MRQDHIDAFYKAADECRCWIGVREPNPLADKWIGRAGYIPKGHECKAKTADNPAFALAGLVVDPTARPEAFKRDTLAGAIDTWRKKFLVGDRLPRGFMCVTSGPERGLVKYHGSAIFADYDLMAIARANDKGEIVFTTEAEQAALFAKVEPIVGRGIGVPMIQHGAEFMWKDDVGAREFEWVLWFGPGRQFKRNPSSMSKTRPH